jgi:hypothetical protein
MNRLFFIFSNGQTSGSCSESNPKGPVVCILKYELFQSRNAIIVNYHLRKFEPIDVPTRVARKNYKQ